MNKSLRQTYYIFTCIIASNLVYHFYVILFPKLVFLLKNSPILETLQWFIVTIVMLTAAEFIYVKTQPKSLLGPIMLIFVILGMLWRRASLLIYYSFLQYHSAVCCIF